MKRWCFTFGLKIFFGILFFGLLLGAAIMLLWNWIVPEVFHGPEINFLQALGLLVLTRILVGFGGWKGKHCCHGHGGHGPQGYWKKRWEDKLTKLSPEEREKVKEKYKKCWGYSDVCGDENPEEKK
jgi:hypothetical protein